MERENRFLPKDILVKNPYFAFLNFPLMNNSFLWQSVFLLICRQREETGLKLEREKLRGCNKGFRASKQIALKAARGRVVGRGGGWGWVDGKGWAGDGGAGWWCLLKGEMVGERERRRRRELDREGERVCVSCVCVWGPTQWGLSKWFISEY